MPSKTAKMTPITLVNTWPFELTLVVSTSF